MKIRRPGSGLAVASALAIFALSSFGATPEQLAGILHGVDVDGKKLVVTPTGKEEKVDVQVNDQTEITTEAGKPVALKDIKVGDGLGIAHNAGVATKILVAPKPSELTGHVKSVGANLKTFVVTETGTTIDVTVAIKPNTSITSVQGKKLELKELKKGDGVGISHTNSVASKVLVNVKKAAKNPS